MEEVSAWDFPPIIAIPETPQICNWHLVSGVKEASLTTEHYTVQSYPVSPFGHVTAEEPSCPVVEGAI